MAKRGVPGTALVLLLAASCGGGPIKAPADASTGSPDAAKESKDTSTGSVDTSKESADTSTVSPDARADAIADVGTVDQGGSVLSCNGADGTPCGIPYCSGDMQVEPHCISGRCVPFYVFDAADCRGQSPDARVTGADSGGAADAGDAGSVGDAGGVRDGGGGVGDAGDAGD
jgi:hypothetical protein